jgi:hypothetical protein
MVIYGESEGRIYIKIIYLLYIAIHRVKENFVRFHSWIFS